MTLGFTVGDVGAWLFILGACVDWYFNLTLPMEDFMKATFKTGLKLSRFCGPSWVSSHAYHKKTGWPEV